MKRKPYIPNSRPPHGRGKDLPPRLEFNVKFSACRRADVLVSVPDCCLTVFLMSDQTDHINTQEALVSYTNILLRFNQGLIFTQTGAMRLAAIAGWIEGLASAGQKEYAQQLRGYLSDRLRQLIPEVTRSDEYIECGSGLRKHVCVLSDDGSTHGFSVCWYLLANREVLLRDHGPLICDWYSPSLTWFSPYQQFLEEQRTSQHGPYRFQMNGGLIWHGPGANSFSVTLAQYGNPWSIHT